MIYDELVLDHDRSRLLRIAAVKKLSIGSNKQTNLGQIAAKPNECDVYIVRMSTLKAAACLLQDSKLEYQQRASEVVVLAEKLEQWIMQPSN